MRGKVAKSGHNTIRIGITPAYAGKRWTADQFQQVRRDHPRVCGEKFSGVWSSSGGRGSPPRMRGKARFKSVITQAIGITPAYAGKSRTSLRSRWMPRDHPRVCGEKPHAVQFSVDGVGSPPRMRGKAGERSGLFMEAGITPAYAGKRLKRSHSIGHFSCILCLFHSVLHRASASGGSRAGPCAPPCLPAQNAVPV